MPSQEESLGEVRAPDRIEVMHMVAIKRVNDLDVGLKARKPDTVKVAALMAKSKKPAEYFLVLAGARLRLEIRAAGTAFDLGDVDLAAEKDPVKRRVALQALQRRTALVSKADLDAFDKANPAPVDQKKLAELRAKVEERANKVKKLRADRDSKTYSYANYDAMDTASSEEFGAWAESKRYDRFLMFLGSVDAHQPAGFTIIKFFRKEGELFLNLPAPMTAAIEAQQHKTGGGKVDFSAARKFVLQKVNSFMLAPYNKAKKGELDKQIKSLEDEMKPLLAELRKVAGR